MLSEVILYHLAKTWPKGVLKRYSMLGDDVTSVDYNVNYALKKQYIKKAMNGLPVDFYGKKVLEIGSGHGGITVFLAVNGASEVVGIDLNIFHLEIARNSRQSGKSGLYFNAFKSSVFRNERL